MSRISSPQPFWRALHPAAVRGCMRPDRITKIAGPSCGSSRPHVDKFARALLVLSHGHVRLDLVQDTLKPGKGEERKVSICFFVRTHVCLIVSVENQRWTRRLPNPALRPMPIQTTPWPYMVAEEFLGDIIPASQPLLHRPQLLDGRQIRFRRQLRDVRPDVNEFEGVP